MMTKILLIVFFMMLTFASIKNTEASQRKDNDGDFESLSSQFILEYYDLYPQSASGLGKHEYDGRLSDNSRAGIMKKIQWYEGYRDKLKSIDPSKLNSNNYIDYRLLDTEVRSSLFSLLEMRRYAKNPMSYAGTIDVNNYIARDFAPIEDRIRSIIRIENQAPEVFANARENLEDVLPKPFVETAIRIAKGNADFLANDLVIALKEVKNETLMNEFNAANKLAINELKNYADYLEKEKLPKADNNYQIGCDKFVKMLEGEMISISPDKILEAGLKEIESEKKLFEEAATMIDPTKPASEVYKDIQKDHPTAEGLIPDTKKNMEAIRQFLIDKNIVTIPSEVRAEVKETPQYARATSFASMDTPGPFEKSTQAYYYVTPVEDSWSEEQKEEWLTAFNFYTTDIVSIHEAYPGHYVQFLHVNAAPVTDLQKILGSYAFSEGWAHYTEKMMIDEGFGSDKDQVTAAKYRMAQLSESLLRLCRLCVSIKMHCQGMSVEDGTQFFMDNCYYEKQPASSEALRGTFDPGYLYYTLGKLMLLKLRDDYKQQEGDNYSLKRFHDEVLSHGSPPVPLLREIMIKDKGKKEEIL